MAVTFRPARGLFIAFLLACVPAVAHGQFLQRYKEGIKAIDDRDWSAAARSFESAIAERPEEKATLPSRAYFKPYLPHYFLGVARFELGDCTSANEAWRESERQGVIAGRPELAEVRRRRAECERRSRQQSALATAEQSAISAVAAAERESTALRALLEAPGQPLPSAPAAALEERRGAAESALGRAREGLAAARSSGEPDGFARVEAMAREATASFVDLRGEVAKLRDELAAQIGARAAKMDSLTADALALLERTAPLASFGRQLGRARADLAGLLAERERAGNAGDEERFAGLASRMSFSMERLEQLAEPPPAVLASAAAAFLRADYAKVLEILDRAPAADARTKAHTLLLRAAARYQLWSEGGQRDASMLAAASADVVESRRALPLSPASAYLSPRFRRFYESEGATAGPAESE